MRTWVSSHLQFQNGIEVIISHSLHESLLLFVGNVRHMDRMQLLAEQEQVFSDKIGVFRLDPAILGSLMPMRYGFLYLFDNLFVFPDIANEQEQAFMKAMRNDDFNTILKLKMRGYQPSENTLKSLQPDVSATTFIAAAKIFQMEGMLKSLQDIKPAQSPITGGNKRSMELGD